MSRRWWFVICVSLLSAGCSDSARTLDTKPEGARLSPREAIQIAQGAAKRQGLDLLQYKAPEAYYHSSGDKRWGVFFDGKGAMQGNHFYIFVDDQTREARYIGGT